MPDFHSYLMRHGEYGVQNLIEQIERREGIRPDTSVPLESRWAFLMQDPAAAPQHAWAA